MPCTAGHSAGEQPRDPKALTLADLAEADLVVAVKEAEHRAMMAEQFPLWKDRIEYWHVDDLDCAEAHEALPHLESRSTPWSSGRTNGNGDSGERRADGLKAM